jgi:hypothetical protein
MGQPSAGRSSERLRMLAAKKIQEIDAHIAQAQGMKRMLEATLGCQCVTADECGKIIRAQTASHKA